MNNFYETHRCEFNAENHTYMLINDDTGETKELTSVTRLLKKHGLSPDYSMVSESVLNAKAERGTLVHKEIEELIKYGEIGMTSEIQDFIVLCEKNGIAPVDSEFIVFDENYAGTVDIESVVGGHTALHDVKTTASLHKASLQWQLSLYAYLYRKMGSKVDYLGGFHLGDNSKFIPVDEIPAAEVDRLIAADLAGEVYEQRSLMIPNDTLAKIVEFEKVIKDLDEKKKAAESQYNELRAGLMEAMKNSGVKSFDNERIKITYIEPTTRDGVDTKALKKEMPDIYAKYMKVSTVKETIKITVRGE